MLPRRLSSREGHRDVEPRRQDPDPSGRKAHGAKEAKPGEETRLREAITAYESALTVHTCASAPLEGARAQNNLCTALRALGECEADPALLRDAIAAQEAALTARAREAAPIDRAGAQSNVGPARRRLGDLTDDLGRLDAAQGAFDLCVTERTRDAVPFDWAKTQ